MREMARVIRPLPITPANLVSSNVLENDYSAWSPGTYSAEARVIHNHRVWEALTTTTKEPGVSGSENDWLDAGATNRWRMFDNKVGTQTVRIDGIEVVIEQDDFVDAVSLLNILANAIRVTVTDPNEGEVYQKQIETLDAGAPDWWEYFFDPLTRMSDVVFDDLPPYAGVQVKVEALITEGEEARIGTLTMGSVFQIGCARWGSSVGIRDFSIKEQDEWGNTFIQQRDYSKRAEFDLIIETPRVDMVQAELAKLRSTACVYIAHRKFTSTIVYGFYRELMTVLATPPVSECTLTIEGLT